MTRRRRRRVGPPHPQGLPARPRHPQAHAPRRQAPRATSVTTSVVTNGSTRICATGEL